MFYSRSNQEGIALEGNDKLDAVQCLYNTI